LPADSCGCPSSDRLGRFRSPDQTTHLAAVPSNPRLGATPAEAGRRLERSDWTINRSRTRAVPEYLGWVESYRRCATSCQVLDHAPSSATTPGLGSIVQRQSRNHDTVSQSRRVMLLAHYQSCSLPWARSSVSRVMASVDFQLLRNRPGVQTRKASLEQTSGLLPDDGGCMQVIS